MSNTDYIPYIVTMALTTYLIRMLPLTFFQKEIKSTFIKSFLYYVPYAVLGAMTFPAIFSSGGSLPACIGGCAIGLYLAYKEKSLITVAMAACLAVYIIDLFVK
ncbi:MAG: AzlD domain-containing protein [Faecalicoccus sp.]|jgi:branched-subunit amino acid transport protein|nr:AzlD domain-containing protein [Faecalicoccus sp.]